MISLTVSFHSPTWTKCLPIWFAQTILKCLTFPQVSYLWSSAEQWNLEQTLLTVPSWKSAEMGRRGKGYQLSHHATHLPTFHAPYLFFLALFISCHKEQKNAVLCLTFEMEILGSLIYCNSLPFLLQYF